MENVLNGLNPQLVFKFFEEISQIPRGSGNEKEISDFLFNFGKNLGLETIQDDHLNVIIKKPATKGYENCPGVILQGHMDMVCEKNKDTDHDFTKDPIKLKIKDDMIYASGTTLGADNGIAVAMGMAVVASDNLAHPAIEFLITSDEEAGMTGAKHLDPSQLNGKYILNLDSEEEGYLLVSCAGGTRAYATIPTKYVDANPNKQAIFIEINGLLGGHSGMDIIKQRANSNKLMGRLLNMLDVDFDLAHICGGAKDNAIPREAECTILVDKNDLPKAKESLSMISDVFKNEFRTSDPGLNIKYSDTKVDKVFEKCCVDKITKMINLIPNGIQTMSMEIDELVESSTNLGVIVNTGKEIVLENAVRSSVETLREEITDRISLLCDTFDAKFETRNGYPAWEYVKDSKLEQICSETYEKLTGKKPKVLAIHAGLECGLLLEKMPHAQAISLGPNMFDVHTPDEHLSISSTKNTWEYLVKILESMNQY